MVDVLVKAGADVNQAKTKVCQSCGKHAIAMCNHRFYLCISVEIQIHIACNIVDSSMVEARASI